MIDRSYDKEGFTPAMRRLLRELRDAGGTLEVLRARAPGYNGTTDTATWRGLQKRGIVRATRLGRGRFRIELVEQSKEAANG